MEDLGVVLCADDSDVLLQMYQKVLAAKGYTVRCCRDGKVALAALRSEPADLVILDVDMPGMTGLQVCAELRRGTDTFDLPIIIVSSNDSEANITEGLSTGADDYLTKPVKSAELLAKVGILLKKRKLTARAEDLFAPGSLFVGKYRIEERIGRGGFSQVFKALDHTQDPPVPVALKIMEQPWAARDPSFLPRFLREAYEHSRLQHRNIVRLLDSGQSHNFYFLVMEFLEGQTLQDLVDISQTVPEASLTYIAYEVLKALEYLHENNMVHRDIKPGNIMLTNEGDIKLLDFGLARKVGDETLSLEDDFHGTPHFVSPEYVLRQVEMDIRTDVYSLGAVLYYAASGIFPLRGKSGLDVVSAHLHQTPDPLPTVAPGVSNEFAELVAVMLVKDREQRPFPAQIRQRFRQLLETNSDEPSE